MYFLDCFSEVLNQHTESIFYTFPSHGFLAKLLQAGGLSYLASEYAKQSHKDIALNAYLHYYNEKAKLSSDIVGRA